MKEALKFSLACLVLVLAMNGMFCFAQDLPWLQLNCHSTVQTNGLQPKHTVIISAVKPTIKQIGTNRWEISFGP